MKVQKQQLNTSIDRSIEGLERVRVMLNNMPDELPVDGDIHVSLWGVYLNIPYDWNIYKRVRRCFGEEWHSSDVHKNEQTGEMFFILTLNGKWGYSLYITLDPNMSGSNCRLEKIGERVVELFEAICA